MSWGVELWDKLEAVASHTQKGIEFCERFSSFLKERCAIESDYASKIGKLLKTYQTRCGKTEDLQFSYEKAFVLLMNEIRDMVGQREVVVESISTNIVRDMQHLLAELRLSRKKYLQDGAKQDSSLQAQLGELDKVRSRYEKSFKDSEKAQEAHKKAEADIHLSRADVEKAKVLMRTRIQQCEQCKVDYASVLLTTNRAQNEHYQLLMPQVFQNLQTMEEKYINRIQEYIRMTSEIEGRAVPIIHTCISGMSTAATSIDSLRDSRLLVELNKTGFEPPGDLPFHDQSVISSQNGLYSSPSSTTSTRSTARTTHRSESMGKGTLSHSRSRKRQGIFSVFSTPKVDDEMEDFSHLPPIQQRKNLTIKIDALKGSISKLIAERNGLVKMQDVYKMNPKLGNASTLNKDLDESAVSLDLLRKDLTKYEGYLLAVDNPHIRSDSLSNSNSESSVNLSSSLQQLAITTTTTTTTTTPNTPVSLHGQPPSTPTRTTASILSTPSISSNNASNKKQNTSSSNQSRPMSRETGSMSSAICDNTVDSESQSRQQQQQQQQKQPLSREIKESVSSPHDSTLSSHVPEDSFEDQDDDNLDLDDDVVDAPEEAMESIGTCVALYSFEAASEGSIAMNAGEEFSVLETDGGDGWTRVQRLSTGEYGFIPTSYVQFRFQTSV